MSIYCSVFVTILKITHFGDKKINNNSYSINTMNNNSKYRYNGCSARGACSINPKTSSLQEVIFMYIKHSAYYALRLEEAAMSNEKIKKIILLAISVIVSNTELSEIDFYSLHSLLQDELSNMISKYKKYCKDNGLKPEILTPVLNSERKEDIIKYIRMGENEFNNKNELLSTKKRNLYKVIFYVIKSLCINIISALNYDLETNNEYLEVLKLLNSLAILNSTEENLKEEIFRVAEIDYRLMKNIREAQIMKYGEQCPAEVSYSTRKGKAILVVGSDIYELENILKSLKDYDIYTHDEMLISHTFPKLREYDNLQGQYGIGFENCLLDFSTFPGPIILTRNSLYNVENLYRGILFTTDFAHTKGIVQIQNNDFSAVIKSAEEAKGFKTGRHCESEIVGFNYKNLTNEIINRLQKNNYSKLVILGNPEGQPDIENYYKQLIAHLSYDIFIISLFCCEEKENLVCVNALYDNYALPYIVEKISNAVNKNLNVFVPVCKRHTITDLIHLTKYYQTHVYWNLNNCNSVNPSVAKTLTEFLNIDIITVPKSDIEKLI